MERAAHAVHRRGPVPCVAEAGGTRRFRRGSARERPTRRTTGKQNLTVPTPPEAVLFDMDGTLIDSEPIWFDTEIAILPGFGYDLAREHWVKVLGQPNEAAAGYLLQI